MRTPKLVEVRFPTNEGEAILSELSKPPVQGCERVVLAMAGISRTAMIDAILVTNPRPVPEGAYYMAEEGTAWDPRFTAAVAQEALRRHLGVLTIHSHSFSVSPRLSGSDMHSFEQLLPALRATVPYASHGSLVTGAGGGVGGVVWYPDTGIREVGKTRWIGSPLRTWPYTPHTGKKASLYKSHIDLIGTEGQHVLEGTTLGVIGLGGGGSHVVQQASRAGFGSLVLIDHDVVEEGNRSRTVGTRAGDVGKLKVFPMKRSVSEASTGIRVAYCAERFPSRASIEKLKQCDLVISCVDTLSARTEVIKFAWRHLIPLIDIGIGTHLIDSGDSRQIDQLAGHVHIYLPGGPCMWDSRLLTEGKVRAESGGHPEYLKGRGGPGQVISFNGVVASLAVTEAIQLVTSAMTRTSTRQFLQYDGITPSLLYGGHSRSPTCTLCETELGAGDPLLHDT